MPQLAATAPVVVVECAAVTVPSARCTMSRTGICHDRQRNATRSADRQFGARSLITGCPALETDLALHGAVEGLRHNRPDGRDGYAACRDGNVPLALVKRSPGCR